MVLSLAHKHMSVSAPGHRGFLWHTIGGSDTNMGHIAHVSRLPGSGNWGIHIGKEPYVGATLATTPDDEWRNNRTANKGIMCMRNRRPSDPRHTMSLADKEDATMKKKTLSTLSLCIALFAVFALVGCDGSASGGGSASKSESKEKVPVAKKTDFIWFKVEMPEGVGVSDSAGKNADRVQLTFPEDENASADRFIPVWKKALTAEESHADQAEKKGDTFQWKDGGSVEYNGRTWLVGTYEDNSGISTMLFTDVEPGSAYVLISNFDQHKKEAETLLNSIEFPDDMKKAVDEAREVEISSIEIK